jgi:hypothetical protein
LIIKFRIVPLSKNKKEVHAINHQLTTINSPTGSSSL